MLRRIASVIILNLLLMAALTSNIQPIRAEPKTWTVDDDGPADFHTIQEAINHANEGDTIYVKEGIYYENVVISKSLTLIGENRSTSIIDGQGYRSTILVQRANVSISGFTIRGSDIISEAGIQIYHSSYVIIMDNIITDNKGPGVFVYGSSFHNIIGGNIIKNNQDNGILIYSPDGGDGWNIVEANSIINNRGGGSSGIVISGSHKNVIEANVITNQGGGIAFCGGCDNTIRNNLIANNYRGIYLLEYCPNFFFHNNFINNTYQADTFYSSMNVWDDGYPSGGNYWSDYTGWDANGDEIGDMPYVIDYSNQDQYPLMSPYGGPPLPKYTLTITTTAGGTTYKRQPGTYTHSKGQKIPLQAIPSTGYLFDHWELDGVKNSAPNIIQVLMNNSHTLHAVFIPLTTLNIITTSGGNTDPTPNAYTYTAGTVVSVTAIPNTNFRFDYWELDSINVGSANPYLVLLDKDHILKAVFLHIPPSKPVGGYSVQTEGYTPAQSFTSYLALIAILMTTFTVVRRKTHRRTK